MFTGIITDIGTVVQVNKNAIGDLTASIECSYDMDTVDMGASISCNGVCLTVVDKENKAGRGIFTVDASVETCSITTTADWVVGTQINLERALRLGDELGGHLVSGHVDCIATIQSIILEGESHRFTFQCSDAYMKYIAPKGSVVINGTSLTVNTVNGNTFGVNIIPHTMEMTIMGKNAQNDNVNLEVDMLSRYVARLLGKE